MFWEMALMEHIDLAVKEQSTKVQIEFMNILRNIDASTLSAPERVNLVHPSQGPDVRHV